MCGIAGFLDASSQRPRAELESLSERMGETLLHRGPDSGGAWVDEAAGVGLAHRRLAIIDLSPEGAQPMRSETGRFVVTFNGEIYNFGELRKELLELGHAFRGHSDTEILLAAVEQWGVARALERSNGMFAFGLWDRRDRLLHLARDRMGEKPLYYGWFGRTFLFGSEIKALRAHPAFQAPIDRDALALYMRLGYVPSPHSIYVGLRKLPPAGLLSVSASRAGDAPVGAYWSHRSAAARGAAEPFRGTRDEAVTALETLLADAVKLRMQADVPLGAFLSGGIDSSTVVALMQAQSTRPVRTFTIGFQEGGYNEAEHAKKVARHLGTDHTELYLNSQAALDVIPRLPALYDEPFADSSQIPTFLVSELTRRHVTVSLSGDGGDELFCGYPRYAKALAIWKRMRWVPARLRALAGGAIDAIPDAIWGAAKGEHQVTWDARLAARARILKLPTAHALYQGLVSAWEEPHRLVRGATEPGTVFTDEEAFPDAPSLLDWMMFVDIVTYLPDDILVKVDRASMAVSLEARVPLLDHRFVEMAFSMPVSMKRRDRSSKWMLRQILHRHVPKAMVERPKMGFAVPVDAWLRGPLREWACDLLSPDRIRREGFLDPAPVETALRQHLTRRRHCHTQLWHVLMFQAWLDAERARGVSARVEQAGARANG